MKNEMTYKNLKLNWLHSNSNNCVHSATMLRTNGLTWTISVTFFGGGGEEWRNLIVICGIKIVGQILLLYSWSLRCDADYHYCNHVKFPKIRTVYQSVRRLSPAPPPLPPRRHILLQKLWRQLVSVN